MTLMRLKSATLERSLTRRRFMHGLAGVGAALPLATFLAACGGDDDDDDEPTATSAPADEPTEAPEEDPTATEEPAVTPTEADEATATEETEPTATEEPEATPTEEAEPTPTEVSGDGEVDLEAIKGFALENGGLMKEESARLLSYAGRYFVLVSSAGFDYQAAFEQNPQEMPGLLAATQQAWLDAHTYYELAEGIVAGVPSLADYDVWIDAGPSAEVDPVEARDWQLELPDGAVLDRPGNIFHDLLETGIWGTVESSVGALIDMDGDGTADVLPEANLFLAASEALDTATGEMNASIEAWEPNLSDVFSAEVTMIPTMNEYFEQWKNSVFVSGDAAEEVAFVSHSRLVDVNGILSGLHTTYLELSPAVVAVDSELDSQILAGFDELVSFVAGLAEEEVAGTVFTPEEADLFGTEAQNQATTLAGQVAQAAALLNVELAE